MNGAHGSVPPPIESTVGDHAVVGDMGTAALIDRWGRLNWMCWPRFGSTPMFRRLIDPPGGCWELAPNVPFDAQRRYVPDTNVLETTVRCASGTAVAYDFMALPAADGGPQLIRVVEGRSGTVPVRSTVHPTPGFDLGRLPLAVTPAGVRIGDEAVVVTNRPELVSIEDGTAVMETEVSPRRPLVMVMTTQATADRLGSDLVAHAFAARAGTGQWWRQWLHGLQLPETCRDAVARSALAVKLLYHRSTGALVAAPTTSLPERIGGSRNWDYRYSWLRDNAMMVLALQQLGQHDEAMAHWHWLAHTAERQGDDLSIAYTLQGEPIPAETEHGHLVGHRNSTPVRVGNDAARQRQHDVYGSVMDAAAHCFEHMADMDRAMPEPVLRRIADLAAQRWPLPDDSIWELRKGRDNHTYSILMCWVALDRAVRLHGQDALSGDVDTWMRERNAANRHLLERSWNADLAAFTSTTDGNQLDAAVLAVPLTGLLPASDARCRSSRDVIAAHLDDNGLLRRYTQDDGLGEPDNPFLLCTLWLADNHILDGNPDRGEELLNRVLATSNDLGLLAEEADPASNEPVGNFPQGLTHLGVIHTATRIDNARRHLRA